MSQADNFSANGNGNETYQWAAQSSSGGLPNWNSFLNNFLFGENYSSLWNQYIQGLLSVQQTIVRANQTLLHAWGIPTYEDLNQLNRQLFEIYNRLDEIESKLTAK